MPRASYVSTIIKERRGIWLRVTDPLGGLSHRQPIEWLAEHKVGASVNFTRSGSTGTLFCYAIQLLDIEVSRE